MGHRAVFAAVAVLFVGVIVTVTSSGEVALVSGPPSLSWNIGDGASPEPPVELELPMEPVEPLDLADGSGPSGILTTIIQVLLIIAAAAVVVLTAVQLWRNRPRLTWRRPQPVDDFDVLADAVEAIAADAEAQRAALLSGAPRNAIVECWSRLETAATSAGVPRHVSDTSTELTERVLHASLVDPAAIEQLSALYREARFSSHPMGEAERQAAIDALDAVHAGLRAGVTPDSLWSSEHARDGAIR